MTATASLTIRNLDPDTKRRLRIRAASNNRSMEEEVRVILRHAVDNRPDSSSDLEAAIHKRFEPLGGVVLDLRVVLDLPERDSIWEPASRDP